MGAAQGMLRLDLHPKQPQYEGNRRGIYEPGYGGNLLNILEFDG